ncbi:MAG: clostripain-related cysteine peptidase [Sedimenticola sp.]
MDQRTITSLWVLLLLCLWPITTAMAVQVTSLVTSESVSEADLVALNPTSSFNSNTPEIHALAVLQQAEPGTRVKGTWISVDAIATPNYEIASKEFTLDKPGQARLHFALSRPDNGWPAGNYRLYLYINDQLAGAAPFSVAAGSATAAPATTPAVAVQPSQQTAAPSPAGTLSNLGPAVADPTREWTILVYLDGDNDLEPFALSDLNEMEAGLPDSGVEVIALVDRAEGFEEGFGNWTGARVYRLRRDNDPKALNSEILQELGEINMGDPNTLRDFVSAALKRYPARHHALVLWDHGGGWQHMAIDHKAPGTEEGHDGLSLPEVGTALHQAMAASPVERLDIVGFDMCLMAQLETAYELKDIADVLVASQAVEPGDGWPYDRILPAFGKGTLGTRRLAGEIVDAYGKFYAERKELVATQSAIDLRSVDAVAKALDRLSSETSGAIPRVWPQISRSLFFAESYTDRTDHRRAGEALASVDLLDTVKRLRQSIPGFTAHQAYADLVDAMDRSILANYTSAKHRLSHGLAIYAPVTTKQFNKLYDQTRLARESGWSNMLKQVHDSQQQHLTKPRVSNLQLIDTLTQKPVSSLKPGGGVRIEATIEGENVLWVNMLHAIHDPENKGHYVLQRSYMWDPEFYKKSKEESAADVVDLMMPEFKGSTNKVWQEFVGMHMYITDGKLAGRATLDGSDLSDLQHATSPILISRPGVGEHIAMVYFDLVTWQAVAVVAQIPQPDGSTALRQIKPEPGDKITLLFEFIPDDGGDMSYMRGETLTWNDGLELLVAADDPGEIVVAVQAESIGGQSAMAAMPIKVKAHSEQEKGFVENARKVKLKDLVGNWQWHNMERKGSDISKWRWVPIKPYTEIKPMEGNPDVLIARFLDMPDPEWKAKPNMVLWDTRLMPTLRLIEFDDDGNPIGAMNFTVLVPRWENGSPRLLLKYQVPKGWLLLWAKRGASSASAGQPGAAPTQQQGAAPPQQQAAAPRPKPGKAVNLAGYWQTDSGEILAMDDRNFQYYEYGELVDAGTYRIRGNTLISTSAYEGTTEQYPFRTDGQTLVLQDPSGVNIVFRKMQ